MVRLGSDCPSFTLSPTWSYFWRKDVRQYCERHFPNCLRAKAPRTGCRGFYESGLFTVLASDNPDIVERSIEEFEYHVDV